MYRPSVLVFWLGYGRTEWRIAFWFSMAPKNLLLASWGSRAVLAPPSPRSSGYWRIHRPGHEAYSSRGSGADAAIPPPPIRHPWFVFNEVNVTCKFTATYWHWYVCIRILQTVYCVPWYADLPRGLDVQCHNVSRYTSKRNFIYNQKKSKAFLCARFSCYSQILNTILWKSLPSLPSSDTNVEIRSVFTPLSKV